jgi:hypothetical protein
MTLFQSISKPVGAMPRMAILPPLFIDVDHVAEGPRRAGHLKPDVEALRHADLPHDVAPELFLRRVDDVTDAELAGELEPHWVDVGDDNLARANACATNAPMMPIGPAPVTSTSSPIRSKDSAVWTALPSGSKMAATSSGHVVGDRHDIVLRQRQKLAERARPVDADAQRIAAQMPPARAAVAAVAADDMALARDPLADAVFGHGTADIGDLADEFVAVTIGTGTVFCAHSSQL